MKRILCLLLASAMLVLTACGASIPAPTPPESPSPSPSADPVAPASQEPVETPSPEPELVNPLTGVETDADLSAQKPVAIMLNNLKQAMPQQGNSQADIIYEVLAEGGITRMLGVYQDVSDLGLVGSVRSARLYYYELALGHDAVYVHAGGSPEFYDIRGKWGLTTVDGVNGYYSGCGLFWRDRDRIEGKHYAVEHSLLTSGEAITSTLTRTGLLSDHADGYRYEMSFTDDGTPAGGQSAATVTVPFSNYKTGVFRYHEDDGLYYAEQYGEAYIDGNDGSQVAVTNLLVLRTQCTVVDDKGRITVDLSSGEGWFACGGRIIPITWEKGGREEQLRYYTADGQPLTLGRGKSYVCIIPLTREITVE